jgi:hypothetical protein
MFYRCEARYCRSNLGDCHASLAMTKEEGLAMTKKERFAMGVKERIPSRFEKGRL